MTQSWGDTLARETRLQRRSVQVTFDGGGGDVELTTVGLTQNVPIGVALPSNAVILGHSIFLTTAFDSPGAGSLDIEVGDDTNDDNSIVAAYDGYTGSANIGLWSNGDTLGINPTGDPSGSSLQAVFTATTDNLSTFTAGSVQINVYFSQAVNPE